jgi:hypothetical protein
MLRTTASEGQSLVDVAIQELGTVAGLFDLADAQGLAITDALTPGQVLLVPYSTASQPDTVNYFKKRIQRINTGDTGVGIGQLARHDFDFPDFDNSDFDTN